MEGYFHAFAFPPMLYIQSNTVQSIDLIYVHRVS